MSVYPQPDRPIGYHRNISDKEMRKREAVVRIAERHYTAAEFSELVTDLDAGRVDVRVYDECIVLMRTF
jgi:hypothetical protein